MKWWWGVEIERVQIEREAIATLNNTEDWFELQAWSIKGVQLTVEAVITTSGTRHAVRLVYPDQYPQVPCWVEPQDATARLSGHQYGTGGPLCLELRPDNWVPSATGADMVRSAYHLLRQEDPAGPGGGSEVDSAHHVTQIQSFHAMGEPIFLFTSVRERLRAGMSTELMALHWRQDEHSWVNLVTDAIQRADGVVPLTGDIQVWRMTIPIVYLPHQVAPHSPTTRAALFAAWSYTAPAEAADRPMIILVGQDEALSAIWVPTSDPTKDLTVYTLPDDAGARAGKRSAAEPPSVAIVGIGSVGSKIAETLVRSGVRHVALVDGDVMLPGNIERHSLDWRDVGMHKVEALKRRLLQISPACVIDTHAVNLDWQRPAHRHANTVANIAGRSLIIDATGDVPTSLLLGAIAAANSRPFLSVEVYEGGLGCHITRSLPGTDPPFADLRAKYVQYCERCGVNPPTSGHRRYESIGEDGEPIMADDAAASIAAAHTARIAIDLLDGQTDTMKYACLLIGFKKGWLFASHAEVIGLAMGDPPPARAPCSDPDTIAFVKSMTAKALHETPDPERPA